MVKITKSQLKELIRQSIDELKEGGKPPAPAPEPKKDGEHKKTTDIMDNPFDKEEKEEKEVTEGGPGSGRPTKPGSAKDIDKKAMSAADAANAKMDAAEKAAKKKSKKESVKESKGKRCTVKEIKMWMKTLEENRYKKTYMADCRRVSWLVNNNLSEDYESMPKSMRKKWTKAQYGRERYLAKEFIKSQKQKMDESVLRHRIREIILELNEGKFVELYLPNDKKVINVVTKIIKQMRLKMEKDYDIKILGSSGKEIKFFILPKHRNKFLELLLKNKIKVRG